EFADVRYRFTVVSAYSNAARNDDATCPSCVDLGAARRPGENRRSVLEQLDATVERPALDHVESDIGIAVVDPLPAAASGDDGKDNHAESVDEAGLQQRAAQGEAAYGAHRFGTLGLHLPHGFNGVSGDELRVRPGKGFPQGRREDDLRHAPRGPRCLP